MDESKEVVIRYRGSDLEADRVQFWKRVQNIETRYLPYFINRLGIFEDDSHERLKDHFFFVPASSRIILKQAESFTLPPEILAEVQAAFRILFTLPTD